MRRPSRRSLSVLAAAVFATAAVAVHGQQPPKPAAPAQEEATPIFRSDTRVVVCHTTVVDKSGHLVTDLPQSAFTVYENGVQQAIKSFRREDVPVSMGLIIDNSG